MPAELTLADLAKLSRTNAKDWDRRSILASREPDKAECRSNHADWAALHALVDAARDQPEPVHPRLIDAAQRLANRLEDIHGR